jgi:sugar phosphate isomerase/epimerase
VLFGSSTTFLRQRPVTAALDTIARAGFAGAEVWMEHIWSSKESPEQIRKCAAKTGLTLTLHAPSYDLNLCSSNPGIRKESFLQTEEALRVAARLGARIVVVHPGRLSTSYDSKDVFWAVLFEVLARLDELAVQIGLRIGIEGMEKKPGEVLIYPADIIRLFSFHWKAIGLTVDLAHAPTIMDPLAYLEQIPALHILHAHCADNSPSSVHLPLGEGNMNIQAMLHTLSNKYDGLVIVEGSVIGRGAELIQANAKYLRSLGVMKPLS